MSPRGRSRPRVGVLVVGHVSKTLALAAVLLGCACERPKPTKSASPSKSLEPADRVWAEIETLEREVSGKPTDPEPVIRLAKRKRSFAALSPPSVTLHFYSEARAHLEAAIELIPDRDRTAILLELARTEHAMFLHEAARWRTYRAGRLSPDDIHVQAEVIRERAVRTDRWKAAAAQLDRLTARPGAADSAEIWYLLGLARLNGGDPRGAESACRKCLDLDALHDAAPSCLAAALRGQGRIPEALALSEGGTPRASNEALEGINTSAQYLKERRFAEAALAAHRAIEIDPRIPAAWINYAGALDGIGDHSEAIRINQRLLALLPGHADTYRNMARAMHKAGRHDEALEAFGEYFRREAPRGGPVYEYANVLARADKPREAEREYRRAMKMLPQDPRPANNLALLLDEEGRREEAISLARQAVALDPDDVTRQFNLATLLRRGGHATDAASVLRNAVDRSPDDWHLRGVLAATLRETGDAAAARDAWRQLAARAQQRLAATPRDVGALRALVGSKEMTGELDDAQQRINAMLAADPTWDELYRARSDCHRSANRRAEMEADLGRAIELAEEAGDYLWRGWTRFEFGDTAAAVDDFRTASRLSPSNVYAALFLSVVLRIDGRGDDARRCLELALDEVKLNEWADRLLRFQLGTLDAERLLRIADSAEQRCEALFFVAEHVRRTVGPEAAAPWYQQCIDTGVLHFFEYKAARWRQRTDGI